MESINHPAARHVPWNKGKLVGQKAPLKQREIWVIRVRLQLKQTPASSRSSTSPSTASSDHAISCDCESARTKAALIYCRTSNLRVVQLLLGHSKLESTVTYLGIDFDDALEIAEQTEV